MGGSNPGFLLTSKQLPSQQREVGVDVGSWADTLTLFIQGKHSNLCFLSLYCHQRVSLFVSSFVLLHGGLKTDLKFDLANMSLCCFFMYFNTHRD